MKLQDIFPSPTVTVLMSTYNESDFVLREAICSILNQTYADFELLIIVDNPSNCQLKDTLTDLASQDSRIRIVENKKNLGLAKSLNKGIGLASGSYICRMDADDVSEPQRIEAQLDYLRTHKLDLVGSRMSVIDEGGALLYYVDTLPTSSHSVAKALRYNNCVPHPTWFGTKELFLQLYRQVPLCEDYDFLIRTIVGGHQVGNVPERLVCYRMSKASISRTHLFEQYLYQVQLTKAYSSHKPFDPEGAKIAISSRLSEERSNKYATANAAFNEGLAQLRSGRMVKAFAALVKVPFISTAYLDKVYRLIRAALIRG